MPEEQDPPKSLHLLLDHRPLLDHRAGATGKKKGGKKFAPSPKFRYRSFLSLPSFFRPSRQCVLSRLLLANATLLAEKGGKEGRKDNHAAPPAPIHALPPPSPCVNNGPPPPPPRPHTITSAATERAHTVRHTLAARIVSKADSPHRTNSGGGTFATNLVITSTTVRFFRMDSFGLFFPFAEKKIAFFKTGKRPL